MNTEQMPHGMTLALPCRVLIIEDEPSINDVVATVLRYQGYSVTQCDNNTAGLDEALRSFYDLIVVDVMLPGLDGFEVCRRLRNGGDLTLDPGTHEVRPDGRLIDLSPTEFNLLQYLMVNATMVLSKAQILVQVWDDDFDGSENVVELYIG